MKFWLVCLAAVFGMTELYQWFQALTLPLPVYGAAGLLLALLSNTNQWLPQLRQDSLLRSSRSISMEPPSMGEAQAESQPEAWLPPVLHGSSASTSGEPQLPNLPSPNLPAPSSISFTIRQS